MLVTDKQYYMDSMLLSKLDLMIKRIQGTDDAIILVDGDEGQGKSEFTTGVCYYVAHKLNRPYNVDHIFFDLDKAMEFAGNTKEQVLHLDEGALGLMSSQWWNKNQQKFLQFVMVARKKKHFIAICIPKFYKLNQYMVEERSIALIHVYSRRNLQKGRFVYYNKTQKERLYADWKRKKYKTYKKHYLFHGTFVLAMKKVLLTAGLNAYEKKKDFAIMSLVKTDNKVSKLTKRDVEIDLLNNLVENNPEISREYLAKSFGIHKNTVSKWIAEKKPPIPRRIVLSPIQSS